MVSALIFPKATRIFVRGDVFGKSWANFLLRSLKLIPIYRARDGESRQNAISNNRSFDQLYEEFKKNRLVLIFPEADAKIEKRLRPLKKGMARMIIDMQSRDDGSMKVAVVPFGLNYTHFKRHRNELMLSFAKPVYLDDYIEEGGSERTAFNKMTLDVAERIKAEMVDVNEGDEEITETALRIIRSERSEPILQFWFRSNERLRAEITASNFIKHSKEESAIRKKLQAYQEALNHAGATEIGSKPLKFWQYLFLLVFIVPASLSWLVMRWGLFFGKKLVDAKVKLDELYESIYFGVGLAYNWILILIGYPVFGILYGWKGIVGWFIFRWLSIPYQHCIDFIEQFNSNRKFKQASETLVPLRNQIIEELKHAGRDSSEAKA